MGAHKRREGWLAQVLQRACVDVFGKGAVVPVEEALKRDLAAVLERLQPAET